MSAYVIALIESIKDAEAYQRYVAQVEATLTPFGGRFLARRPAPEALEGEFRPARAIVLEFPDEDAARAWHASPAYQPVLRLRQAASRGTLLILPGYGPSGVAIGGVCYTEIVTPDPQGARRAMAAAAGWTFAGPHEELGGAQVAQLPGGALYAVRAPLSAGEGPLTRAYVRVADLEAAVGAAASAGAKVLLEPTSLEGRGRIAIWSQGGIEQGAWELP